MRIVTWNCCRGPFDRKLAALEQLQPDIAVIAEAVDPGEQTDHVRWFPSNASRLGIQVRAFNGYRLPRIRKAAAGLPNCVAPVRVSGGPADFNLLAVWTWPAPSYTRAFLNGLAAYARLLQRGPTVVAGDFNGDGKADLAVADQLTVGGGNTSDDSSVAVLLNDGTGNFNAPVYYKTGPAPRDLLAADFASARARSSAP